MTETLIEVAQVSKSYTPKEKWLSRNETPTFAVRDVSLKIKQGETLGLVGESGSGKTTLGKLILQMIPPTEGLINYRDVDIRKLSKKEKQGLYQKMQIIFQDPYSSLNPQRTALQSVMEPLEVANHAEPEKQATLMLERVGIKGRDIHKYPAEFSGGQRQRIGIARAIAVHPEFIVCDEAISALDVSIQAQIISLLMALQEEYGLTYLFISHDLAMVRYISTRIAVMFQGKLVEIGPTESLFNDPQHPYTKNLLSAIPIADPKLKKDFSQVENVARPSDNGYWKQISEEHFVWKEQ